jgi:PASTA domain/PKD domain
MVVGRRHRLRRTGQLAAAVGVTGLALAFAASASPATAPADGAPECWFQTNGPSVDPGEGDWYTSPLTASDDHRHLFQIAVPDDAAFPVRVRVHGAASSRFSSLGLDVEPNPREDEVPGGTLPDPTRFTLERPGGNVLRTETFQSAPHDSTFEATIRAVDGPGTYLLTSETGARPISGVANPSLNNDQNSFRIEVEQDGAETPEPDDDVRIAFTQTTITCTAATNPLRLAYGVPEGATDLALRNFDLERGGDRVTGPLTYTSPTGVSIPGTISGERVWNGPPTLTEDLDTGEDAVPLGPGQHGPWSLTLGGVGPDNQVIFEALADGEPLPLSVVSLNQAPEWIDPGVVSVGEPAGFEPSPVQRTIALHVDEPDGGQTLRFSVPDGGDCRTGDPHPFAGVTVAPGSVTAGPENETATLRLSVGPRDAATGPHCVRVRVFDGGASRDLQLMVDVTEANSAPTARAGLDRTVHEPHTRVTLHGGGSFDPDGDPLEFTWRQVHGPAIALTQAGRSLTFRAPRGRYTFQLTVSDGRLERTDRVGVRVGHGARIRLGSFVDPGRDGPWRVRVTWGDRTKATTRIQRRPGALRAPHAFLRRGIFGVTVRVTDADRATGVSRFRITVRRPCIVPNLKDRTLRGARAALERRNCSVGRVTHAFSSVRSGLVISQSRRPGTTLATGAKVQFTLSKGRRP